MMSLKNNKKVFEKTEEKLIPNETMVFIKVCLPLGE